MSRTNPRVEQLELQASVLRRQLDERRRDPGDYPFLACDNSCLLARPTGMATNGGCRCEPHKLRQAVVWWKRRAAFLEETIRDMKSAGYEEPRRADDPKEER